MTRAGNQAALEKLIAGRPRFSSIFDATAPYGSPPRCPPGFTASNAFNPLFTFKDKATGLKYQLECLRVGGPWGAPGGPLDSAVRLS